MKRFPDRRSAGRLLAERLLERNFADPVVLALPRGGVPVGFEVAKALRAPLDLVMVRKIGVPSQPELAAAAIVNGDDPQLVVNERIARSFGLGAQELDALAQRQLAEIRRRREIYLKGRAQVPVTGKTAIVVDDGIATGATMSASLKAVRQWGPSRLVLAVPVAPADTLDDLRSQVDDVVCLDTPSPFLAVGAHYADFAQTTDEEVVRLLDEANRPDRGQGMSSSA